jgi:DNA-binding transcriptional ArsR family regulator
MPVDNLSATFAALADPTRRAILGRLAKGQSSVTELASPFTMSLPAISKHLKVLEKAGLIERGRDAQWRPCRLKAKPLEEASHWIDQYRSFWEESFDRLEAYLAEVQSKGDATSIPSASPLPLPENRPNGSAETTHDRQL